MYELHDEFQVSSCVKQYAPALVVIMSQLIKFLIPRRQVCFFWIQGYTKPLMLQHIKEENGENGA